MIVVEWVALWISIVTACVSITLAVVAIRIASHIDSRNLQLNQRFTETLTSINGQSTQTLWTLNVMVNNVMETLLDVQRRRSATSAIIPAAD